jgi:hypothetical protein
MLALLQTDDGEVARAATDIGDQDQFLGLHPLVIMGGGDRLGDEDDVAEAGLAGNGFEHGLGAGIPFCLVRLRRWLSLSSLLPSRLAPPCR